MSLGILKVFKWLQVYIENGKQRVMYSQSNSSLKSLNAGVPQGSVLGPLLFLIYMYVNDVADNILTFCRLFTDDKKKPIFFKKKRCY